MESAAPEPLCVGVRVAVLCEHCDASIPVNGVVQVVKCHNCHKKTSLSGRLGWKALLNYHNPAVDIFTATARHQPGKGDYGAWHPVKLNTRRIWPLCPRCSTKFPKEKVLAGALSLSCPKCHTMLSIQEAPAVLTKAFPCVRTVVGATIDRMEGTVSDRSPRSEAEVIRCVACGAPLPQGRSRRPTCDFCKTENRLPEAPSDRPTVPTRNEWFIVFDGTVCSPASHVSS